MIAAVIAVSLLVSGVQSGPAGTSARKTAFIKLLGTLPTKGEFYTEEAISKAAPYLPVLFSLTERDIRKYDIYPFLAVSRGLCDREQPRAYAVRHFDEIRHPRLKLFWGAMLFDAGEFSPEIVRYLQRALSVEKQAKLLAEALGPGFEGFKVRVYARR